MSISIHEIEQTLGMFTSILQRFHILTAVFDYLALEMLCSFVMQLKVKIIMLKTFSATWITNNDMWNFA